MENEELTPSDGGYEAVGERVSIFMRGRTWYANFQHGAKQNRKSLNTRSKKQARLRALQIESQLASGQWEAESRVATIAEAVEAYLDYLSAERRAAKTLTKYRHVLKRVAELATQRKAILMSALDLKFLDRYRRMRVDEGAALKTLYNECTILKQLINFAMSRGMAAKDSMKGAKLKKPKPTRQPCWTRAEVDQILAACPEPARPALALLAETGMRFGELAWLTWEDVSFAENVIRVRPKEGWKPKSGDERAIPMSPAAKGLLEGLPKAAQWVVTMPPSARVPERGRQWSERNLLSALKRVLKSLKMVGKLHTFRHAFISHALLQGVPVAVVQQWVGHVDPEIIKVYTHVHDQASQAAMQRLHQVNQELQKPKETSDGQGIAIASAQNQHTDKED